MSRAQPLDPNDKSLYVRCQKRREVVSERGAAELPGRAAEGIEEREEEGSVIVATLAEKRDHTSRVDDEVFFHVDWGRRRRRWCSARGPCCWSATSAACDGFCGATARVQKVSVRGAGGVIVGIWWRGCLCCSLGSANLRLARVVLC